MRLPTSVEPVNAILSRPGWLDQERAGLARTGDDVDDSGRKLRLLEDLRQHQRRERRGLRRLEHHGVAGGERRRDLPRRHQQREVPRDHLPGDSERPRAPAGERVLELVGPARVVEEVRRHQRQVDVARLADRLAAVHRLDDGELAAALLHDARDAVDVLAALARRELRPHAIVGAARGGDRAIDVLGARLGHLRERLLGRRVDGREPAARARRRPLAVDEEVVARRAAGSARSTRAPARSPTRR